MQCPYCRSTENQVKAGLSDGLQRYKCGTCKRRYTPAKTQRGYPESVRQHAIHLYNQGYKIRQIGRELGINHCSVQKWVKQAPDVKQSVTEPDEDSFSGRKRPTIADVAREANVSTSTISNYLNNKGKMSEATRNRIRDKMTALHFTPNSLVRAIRLRRTHIIGLLIFGLGTSSEEDINSITPRLIYGIKNTLDEENQEMLVYTGWPLKRSRYTGEEFLSGHIDGLIWVAPEFNEPILENLASAGLPTMVLLSRHVPENVGYINLDNQGAIIKIVEHLYELGHRRIAYLGPVHSSNYKDRRDGYRKAIAQLGLHHDLVLEASPRYNYYDWETYRHTVDTWLSLKNPPTAIVTSDDGYADIVIHELNRRGLIVPSDMSVTGFNNIPLAKKIELTTIDQRFEDIGRDGVKRLMDLIKGAPSSECRITISPDIVIRRTTGRIKEG